MENLEFREIKLEEIDSAMVLVKEVFDEFEKPFYSQEGADSFYKFIDIDNIKTKVISKEITLFCAFDNDSIIGVIGTKNINHICLLFINKNYHKKRSSQQVIFYH